MDILVIHDGSEIKSAQVKQDNTTVIGTYSVITGEKSIVRNICAYLNLTSLDKIDNLQEPQQ